MNRKSADTHHFSKRTVDAKRAEEDAQRLRRLTAVLSSFMFLGANAPARKQNWYARCRALNVAFSILVTYPYNKWMTSKEHCTKLMTRSSAVLHMQWYDKIW